VLGSVLAVALVLGRPAPPLAYRDAAGRALTLGAGRPTVVSFWASWCGPCREELPRLQRAGARVRVVALNYGERPATAAAYLQREGLTRLNVGFVHLSDPRLWPIPGLPSSVLLDAAGRVRAVQYGPLSQATLDRWLAPTTAPHGASPNGTGSS